MNSKKQIQGIDNLEKKIGYSFNDKSILIQSLTHTSFDNNKFSSMERLEFLGDRVLGLVISEAIFSKFDLFNEGDLSKYHNYLVQRSTCVIIAKKINLNNFIIFGKSEFSKDGLKDSILSNILESLIGAIFEDSNYETTKRVVLSLWNDLINDEFLGQNILNPKSELQEITLSLKKDLPDYKIVSVDGKDHNPEFTVSLSVSGYKSILAKGKSKQEAEKNAARKMLKLIK
jgi:ribonuclease-3